jgi:hypothetical protein
MNRKTVRMIPLLVLAVLTLACGRSPGSTVKEFYEAVSKGRTDDAIELVSAQVVNSIGRDKLRLGIQNSAQQILNKGGVKDLEITEEKVSGDVASVTIIIKYGNDTQEIENVRLVKEDGNWRLQPSK